MQKISNAENKALENQIFDFCRHVSGSENITAIAYVDNYSATAFNEKTIVHVLLIVTAFQPRIMSYIKTVNERTIFVYAVDRSVFERDIETGILGEAMASKLVFPYTALFGEEYLFKKEVVLKKRLILELLENLAASFPELINRIQIQPQYFLYETLLNRIRVFPILSFDISNMTNALAAKESTLLSGYIEALRELEADGKVFFKSENIIIAPKFLRQCQDPRIKIVNLSKNAPRTVFTSFFGLLPQLATVFSQNTEAFLKTQKLNWRKVPEQPYISIDPKKYVFVETSKGLLSLSNKIDIKGFAQSMLLKGKNEDVDVEPLGGMLNDVYLINVHGNGTQTKVLAKRFKDMSGFKWFPLTIWALATRTLVIPAQARLAKEYAINEFLLSAGFNVPKILHVSNAERLIFMEYIEGVSLSQAIKEISAAQPENNVEGQLSLLKKAGEIIAKVHAHNIVLGDTKPDNMLVKPDGSIYMIDFEQASQNGNGDKAWDIAVFLYYAGHYIYPINGAAKAETVAKAFIQGYLTAGGDVKDIRKAGTSKYTRVFGIFTMWSIISVIANVCKKTEPLK